MEKKDWRTFPNIAGFWILWAVLLAVCIPGIAAGERLKASLAQPLSGEFAVQQAGAYQEQAGYTVTGETGEMKDFLVLSDICLNPGVYRIVIDYEADVGENNSTYGGIWNGSYRALLGNLVKLPSGLRQMDYQVWLKEKTTEFAVHVDFGGQGSLVVSDIRVYRTNQGSILMFLVIFAVGLLKALYTVWKKSYGSDLEEYRKGQMSLLILCGVVLIVSAPLFVNYFISGDDLPFHLLRIEGLKNGIMSGKIPVRIQPGWMCDHGYATSIFYCDTFLLIPALLRMAGFPVLAAYNFYVLAVNVATAGIAYWSFRRFSGSRQIGVLGSTLYTLAPYRMYNIYGRSAVGEYTAMTFLPLIFLGFFLIFTKEEKTHGGWLVLALGFTGIIQSHVITCELAAGFSVLLCVLMWKRLWQKEVLSEILKAVSAAIVWNLWYLVPFVQYFLTEDLGFRHTSARTIQEWGLLPAHLLILWPGAGKNSWFYAYGMADTVPAIVGGALLGAIVLFLWIAQQRREEKKCSEFYRTAGTALALGCVAMICSLSLFPWDILQRSNRLLAKLISSLQFPMRFLLVAVMCFTVLGCAAVKLCVEWKGAQTGRYVTGILMGCALLSGIVYGNDILFREEAKMVVATAESMDDGVILGAEYLPYGTQQELISYMDTGMGPGVSASVVEKDALEIVMDCSNAGDRSYVDCSLLYYSGYTAGDVVTGEELVTEAGENGLVRVWLPAGYEGRVRVRYQEMWYWRLAELVSLLGVAGMLILLVRNRGKGNRKKEQK